MRNRLENVKSIKQVRDFNMMNVNDTNSAQPSGYSEPIVDFNKIRVGAKTLDDAILNLSGRPLSATRSGKLYSS